MRYPRFNIRCGFVITKGPVAFAPPNTYAHPDVSSNHRDNILHPPTGLLRTAYLKHPKRITIGVIFVPLRTHGPLLTIISSAVLITPLFVSNAGEGFRETSGFSYWGLLGSGRRVFMVIPSSYQLGIPPDTQGSVKP